MGNGDEMREYDSFLMKTCRHQSVMKDANGEIETYCTNSEKCIFKSIRKDVNGDDICLCRK